MSHTGNSEDDFEGLDEVDLPEFVINKVKKARMLAREIIEKIEPRHILGLEHLRFLLADALMNLDTEINMKLNKNQIEEVLRTAVLYVNYPRSKDFSCVDFVRKVYSSIGIEIPKLKFCTPPAEFNITKEELNDPPAGHIIFLKDRTDSRKYREWTHVGIIMLNNYCIHCSLFFGKKVVISSLSDMYKKYDFAESINFTG